MAKQLEYPIVWCRNLPYRTSVDALYKLFGQHGNIYQIRVPAKNQSLSRDILGTCMVVYNNLDHARHAAKELNGVNYEGRYLVTSLFQVDSSALADVSLEARTRDLESAKALHGID